MRSYGRGIGIVASSFERGQALKRELGFDELEDIDVLNVPVIADRHAGRGLLLNMLLFDESVLPIKNELVADLYPCLLAHGGHAYVIRRLRKSDIA